MEMKDQLPYRYLYSSHCRFYYTGTILPSSKLMMWSPDKIMGEIHRMIDSFEDPVLVWRTKPVVGNPRNCGA